MLHEVFSAFGEVNRLQIIECLASGPKTVGVIAGITKIPMVNISHHLGILSSAGITSYERKGRFVEYRLHPTNCKLAVDDYLLTVHLPKGRGYIALRLKV